MFSIWQSVTYQTLSETRTRFSELGWAELYLKQDHDYGLQVCFGWPHSGPPEMPDVSDLEPVPRRM